MTLLTIFGFGKENILINDSLVIFSVMAVLLALLIKNLKSILLDIFNSVRQNTENNLTIIVKDILKFSIAYRTKLEDIINLNMKRSLLLPSFENTFEDVDPISKIKEVSFNFE